MLILLLMLPPSAFAADTLGRLFTTPAERASLDAQRQLRKVQELDAATKEEETAAPIAVPADISVQGYVKRSDGKKGTVWVNRMPLQEDTNTTNIEVGKLKGDSNQVQLRVPGTGKNLKLKAGQTYSPDTDSISEVNERTNLQQQDNTEDEGSIGTDVKSPSSSRNPTNSSNEPH
ncbi:MAG TPA: hypothetical protein VIE91_10470 [Methylophilaceae bacterium]|jgi:hypothetical protein